MHLRKGFIPIRKGGKLPVKVDTRHFVDYTRQIKGYPFEVVMPPGAEVKGVVPADHIKYLDWRGRRAEFICVVAERTMEEVVGKLHSLL